MGIHTHGPVSTAAKHLLDEMTTGMIADATLDLGIDTSDYLGTDDWDYFRQKVIDHFADLAAERSNQS